MGVLGFVVKLHAMNKILFVLVKSMSEVQGLSINAPAKKTIN